MATASFRLAARSVGIVSATIMCAIAIQQTIQIGLSRALAARRSSNCLARAIEINPADPDNYQLRAELLMRDGRFDVALNDLRAAIRRRPDDYRLWLLLGEAFDQSGDEDQALSATLEARRLAPSYATVSWQTAILLLKRGRQEEAFKEVRAATLLQPKLFPQAVELAWKSYGQDTDTVRKTLSPVNLHERITMAQFFLGNGNADAAMSLLQDRTGLNGEDRRQLVKTFFNRHAFPQAYALWSEGLGEPVSATVHDVYDGGFEKGRFSGDPTFGWSVTNTVGSRISFDESERHSGVYSLRLDWNGDPPAGVEVVSQTLIVNPNTHYRLSFACKAQNLVTVGVPNLSVTNFGKDPRNLAKSSLSTGSGAWETHTLDFTTGQDDSAVHLGIRRDPCAQAPCPIFGSLWLDDFSLEVVSQR